MSMFRRHAKASAGSRELGSGDLGAERPALTPTAFGVGSTAMSMAMENLKDEALR